MSYVITQMLLSLHGLYCCVYCETQMIVPRYQSFITVSAFFLCVCVCVSKTIQILINEPNPST